MWKTLSVFNKQWKLINRGIIIIKKTPKFGP